MATYVRPDHTWQELPSHTTAVNAGWLSGVDNALVDLAGATGRVSLLESLLFGQPPLATPAGQWFCPLGSFVPGTSATLGNNTMRLTPWWVQRTITIDQIGAETAASGDAGSKFRIAVYADDGTGYPGALALDAGQIAGDAVGFQPLVVSLTLARGLYWGGGAVQSATTVQPTMRTIGPANTAFRLQSGSSPPAAAGGQMGYSFTVSGAAPGAWSVTRNPAGQSARILVRAA